MSKSDLSFTTLNISIGTKQRGIRLPLELFWSFGTLLTRRPPLPHLDPCRWTHPTSNLFLLGFAHSCATAQRRSRISHLSLCCRIRLTRNVLKRRSRGKLLVVARR